MKKTYLRHIYTWVDREEGTLSSGWDIPASSCPDDRLLLSELEKAAGAARPDWQDGIPVETLIHSPYCGYIKLRTLPLSSGNEGRPNKIVYIFQPREACSSPVEYLWPGDVWGETGKGNELDSLRLDLPDWDRRRLLEETGDQISLSRLMQLVYKTVTGEMSSLNLVCPDWRKEDYPEKARRIMFLIHDMLPDPLRRKAGYVSLARTRIRDIPFYFSDRPLQGQCLILSRTGRNNLEGVCPDDPGDSMETCVFRALAEDYRRNRPGFTRFSEKAERMILTGRSDGDLYRKLQWLYVSLSEKKEGEPGEDYIRRRFPELLYWASLDPAFAGVVAGIRTRIPCEDMEKRGVSEYLEILAAGAVKSSADLIADEVRRVLDSAALSGEELDRMKAVIREKNEGLYRLLKKSPPERTGGSIPILISTGSPDEKKEEEEQMDQSYLKTESRNGQKEETVYLLSSSGDEPEIRTKEEDQPAGGSLPETAETRSLTVKDRGLSVSLITGLVSGFMTGCMLYLAHYCLRLGHWKIAPCLFGIWLLMQCSSWYLMRQSHLRISYFYVLGISVIWGLIIEFAVWRFQSQRLRLYILAGLGAATFLIQCLAMRDTAGAAGDEGES